MKRLLRYGKGAPKAVLSFGYQQRPNTFVTWADSDIAGREKSRRSTSAGVVKLGSRELVAKSSGDCNFISAIRVLQGS